MIRLFRKPMARFEATSIGIRATVAGARGEPSSYVMTLFDDAQQKIIVSSRIPGKFRRGMARLSPKKMIVVDIYDTTAGDRYLFGFLNRKRVCRLEGLITRPCYSENGDTGATVFDFDVVDGNGETANVSSENDGPFRKALMDRVDNKKVAIEIYQERLP